MSWNDKSLTFITVCIFTCIALLGCTEKSGGEKGVSAESRGETGSGQLLIVGGALRSDNASVYRAFIDAIPSAYPDVAIVPAASGRPAYYAKQFAADLRRHGFEGDVTVLPIALVDDPSTESVDESTWSQGGADTVLAEHLASVGGIWFVGGDQTRITATLKPDGRDTPVLTAIRKQLSSGAVVGGTSAGAAIMSDTMIAAGDSLSALTLPVSSEYAGMESQEAGQLMLSHGLGFLPIGLVDQHFDRKARLGRLVRALGARSNADERIGFGVDEDTALLADLSLGEMKVLGAGNVVLVDGREAVFSEEGERFTGAGIAVPVLSAGDRYFWREQNFVIDGSATLQKEAFSYDARQGAGLAVPNGRLDHLLGFSLLDNRSTEELRRYSFDDETGKGVLFRFRQLEASRGYWRYGSGTKDQYSIVNVALDVEPVRVTLSRG
mgnify:CR=1 FL=1